MIHVIGKLHSTPTKLVLKYLDENKLVYTYHELDDEKLSGDHMWSDWMVAHKISGLPVVKLNSHFTVGNDFIAIAKLINSANDNH